MTGIVHFKGTRVSFYKRAQILVADLWGLMEARGEGDVISIDWLTMFADYRVPQALVYLGVLRYSDALLRALTNGKQSLRSGKNTFQENCERFMTSCRMSGRRAAQFWRQERGRDPRLFDLGGGADQRPFLQAGAGERHADIQHQLGNH